MRKVTCVAVAGLAGALALAAPAMAVMPKQKLAASIKPTKIGAAPKRPVPVTLDVDPFFDVATPAGLAAVDAAPFATTKAHVYFDRRIVFNTRAFKTCTVAAVADKPDACVKGSEVGGGSAVSRALRLSQTDLRVRAFNGPNRHLLLRVDGTTPRPVHGVIDGRLKSSTGPYAWELVFTIPSTIQQPLEGAVAALVDFRTTIPAKPTGTGRRSYVSVKGCPKAGLKIGYKGEYTDKTTQTVSTKIACRR